MMPMATHNGDTGGPQARGRSQAAENDVITFGCRLNAYESQAMSELLAREGVAGSILVNTCAVTGEAMRQARQAIRRARRHHPDARIIVTGCGAQVDPDQFEAMTEVDHVIGNSEKLETATYAGLASGEAPRVQVADIQAVRETAHHLIAGFGTRARAYLQIQNGCDHRCTFCIIPFGRGPSRSVPLETVVAQTATLVERGYREVVLTGVDITAYGADLAGGARLGGLVKAILKGVPQLERLRLSSIDSIEADADLFDAIGSEERLMPHFHLSLQAGDDLTLKRMKRRHLRADAVDFCRRVRDMRPDVAFGADLIAGFPTETEEMFTSTLSLVDDCGLNFLHVFPYSARPGSGAHAAGCRPNDQVAGQALAPKGRRRAFAPARCAARPHLGRLDGVRAQRPDAAFLAGACWPSRSQRGHRRGPAHPA
jgi:threonylcarbamoyladenosine tRNA methylthiotransferase MtaB